MLGLVLATCQDVPVHPGRGQATSLVALHGRRPRRQVVLLRGDPRVETVPLSGNVHTLLHHRHRIRMR
jgi:hypothetical protein